MAYYIKPQMLISELKQQINQKLHIDASKAAFYYGRKKGSDHQTIKEIGIKPGHTLILNGKVLGGHLFLT